MPCLSHGRRARGPSGGQRGWPGPAEPRVTLPWDGRARRTSPRGRGGSGGASSGGSRGVGARACGACRAPARGGPSRWGAPRGVGRWRRASAEVGEDLVDHRRLGDEREDPHRPTTRRTRERVHFENLLKEGSPSATGLGWCQPGRGDEGGRPRPVCGGGRGLAPHPARAIGIPVVVPCRDVPLVGDVHQDPGPKTRAGPRSRCPPSDRPPCRSGRSPLSPSGRM